MKLIVFILASILILGITLFFMLHSSNKNNELYVSYPLEKKENGEKMTLDQFRYQLYQQLSVKTLKDLCHYDENKNYCFQQPKNLEQFRKSIKLVSKDAIMNAINNKNYYYLILIILKINSMEMNFLGYEDCIYFYCNPYGTAIVTSILHKKEDLRKITLIRVSDLFKIFNNDCFRLKNDKEIDDKIKELGYEGEDASNYKIFYKSIVKSLFEGKDFIDNMNNNQTEDMPFELFAKYGTAIYLSNYLFNQNKEECDKIKK